MFRLKRTPLGLWETRRAVGTAYWPGLAGEGAGLKSSSDSVDQTTHPGVGFSCQENRMAFKGKGHHTQQDLAEV